MAGNFLMVVNKKEVATIKFAVEKSLCGLSRSGGKHQGDLNK